MPKLPAGDKPASNVTELWPEGEPGNAEGDPVADALKPETAAAGPPEPPAGPVPTDPGRGSDVVKAGRRKAPVKPKSANGATRAKRPTLSEVDEHFRILYHGDPGRGKTTNLAALARLGYIVYINSEGGLKAGPLKRLGIPLDNIEPRPDREAGERVTWEFMRDLAWEIRDRIDSGEQIVGVCWDTGNDIYTRLLQQLVDRGVSRAEVVGTERDEWNTEIGDYGDVSQQMRRLVRYYHDLPCHFVLAYHSRREQAANGSVAVIPHMPEKLRPDVNGYMDIICHVNAEEVSGTMEYHALTRPAGVTEAKDRYMLLPRRLANPTADRVVAYLNGSMTTATDPDQQAVIERKRAEQEAKA